jgi:hypothetical protein
MFVNKVNVDGVNWGIQSSARNILGSFFPLPLMILKSRAHPDLLIQMGKMSLCLDLSIQTQEKQC